jgi:hypothetical protein
MPRPYDLHRRLWDYKTRDLANNGFVINVGHTQFYGKVEELADDCVLFKYGYQDREQVLIPFSAIAYVIPPDGYKPQIED